MATNRLESGKGNPGKGDGRQVGDINIIKGESDSGKIYYSIVEKDPNLQGGMGNRMLQPDEVEEFREQGLLPIE